MTPWIRELEQASEPSAGARLRRAAILLFAEKGFEGTSIRDLASGANLSTASLYHYMPTKQELLYDLICDSIQRLLRVARIVVSDTADPAGQIGALTQLHVFSCALRRAEIIVVDHELRSLSEAQRSIVVKYRDGYEELWQAAITHGRDLGMFIGDDLGILRLAILDMCSGVANWFTSAGRLSLPELGRTYMSLVLAILTGAPRSSVDLPDLPDPSHYIHLVTTTWPETVDLQ